MTSSLIILCDHRGRGLDRWAPPLAARGYRVVITRNLRRSVERIEEERPGLLILDSLSSAGAVELKAIDAARGGAPPLPLLIVCEPDGGLDALVSARHISEGAWDVVRRDAATEELYVRIERLQNVGTLLDEMVELRHLASHDDHTNLLRPKAFQKRLSEHFSATQRHGFPLALALLDLDSFGAVNKAHDHTVGDSLIAQVGLVIRRALRREDVAGRLGGDEFAVLLPYTKKINAARVVNRLRKEIRMLSGRPPGATKDVVVSASIGFDTFDGKDIDSAHTLRRNTEHALRTAKRQGGDRSIYYRSLFGPSTRKSEASR